MCLAGSGSPVVKIFIVNMPFRPYTSHFHKEGYACLDFLCDGIIAELEFEIDCLEESYHYVTLYCLLSYQIDNDCKATRRRGRLNFIYMKLTKLKWPRETFRNRWSPLNVLLRLSRYLGCRFSCFLAFPGPFSAMEQGARSRFPSSLLACLS